MPFAALALPAASLLGGIFSLFGHRQKPLTPEELARFFGPEALGKDTVDLFNQVINSPAGQSMIQQAQGSGARISQNVAQRLAASGIAGGGGESGVGSFAAAAGQEAGNVLQTRARGDIFSKAMEAALQNLQMRAGLAQQGRLAMMDQPTTMEKIGGAISGAASSALANYQPNAASAAPTAQDLLNASGGATTPYEAALTKGGLRGLSAPIGYQNFFAPSGLGKPTGLSNAMNSWMKTRTPVYA
jgi:hypothetical protein